MIETSTSEQVDELIEVLSAAWKGGFKTKSNLARKRATTVSAASERSLITTRTGPSSYGEVFFITPKGLDVLWAFQGIT